MKLKVEEMQWITLTTVFMAQEEKNKAEIERLNKALQAYEQEDRTTLETPIHPSQEQMPITKEGTTKEEDLEEGPAPEEEHLKVAEFQALEEELKAKISQEMDPVAKANMEWEQRIIHSANMKFFEYGDAYQYFHLPTLPLPLLKMESQAIALKLKPNVPEEEVGGWADVDLAAWRNPAVLAHQPK